MTSDPKFPKILDKLPPDYSVTEFDKAQHPFTLIQPPNRLKKKVGDASNFSAQSIADAQEEVRKFARNYMNEFRYDVEDMEKHLEALQKAELETNDEFDRKEELRKTNWYAHEIKSQAGTIGFPFITRVSASMCLYLHELEERGMFDDLAFEILNAHIDTLFVIADKRIKDEGGKIGLLVAEGLEVCVKKHLAQDPAFLKSDVTSYLRKMRSTIS